MPDGVFHDGIDMDTRKFYRDLRASNDEVKTSAPSPGEFLNLYKTLSQIYEAAIVISPPKELTHTWSSAHMAAQEIGYQFPVHVVDSRTAGPAEGFIALAAARLAAANNNPQAILAALDDVVKNVGFVGALDTLELLIKGGRIREAQQWITSRLQAFPVLAINDGQIRLIGMARTKEKAHSRMVQWIKKTLPADRIALAVCHTDAPEGAQSLSKKLVEIYHPEDHFITELTPIIGAHAGPGVLGVSWWDQSEGV